MLNDALTASIIGCAFKVHRTLGTGFLEKVYENALRLELESCGLKVEQQAAIKVWYAGRVVGDFCADLLVSGEVIVELKAMHNLGKEHEAQLVNYLNATDIEIGLLINFGSSVQVKRKYRDFKRAARAAVLPNEVD
jgi:GxxExxY protein